MEMRKCITDNGYEMMLPADDERVMTIDELAAKYSARKSKTTAPKTTVCPKCHTHCYGDCDN